MKVRTNRLFTVKILTRQPADFYTGKDEIDREEEAFLAAKAAKEAAGGGKKNNWFYKTFVSWLF